MNTKPIISIKHLFIGVLATLALLAWSSRVMAQTIVVDEPPFGFPPRVCQDTVVSKSGDEVIFQVEAGYRFNRDGLGNPIFINGSPDPASPPVVGGDLSVIGDWPLALDECPAGSAFDGECVAWYYRFSFPEPGVNVNFTNSQIAVLSNRFVVAMSANGTFVGNTPTPEGKVSRSFERVEVVFAKPANPGDPIIGTVYTDEAKPAVVTGTGTAKKVKPFCATQGAGGDFELPETPPDTLQCVGLGKDDFSTMRLIRRLNGKVNPLEVEFFLRNPGCKIGPGFSPPFAGLVTNKGNFKRSSPGAAVADSVTFTGGDSPTKIEFVTTDGDAISICYDLQRGAPAGAPCNPLDLNTPNLGTTCTFFCAPSIKDGNCTGSTYACIPDSP